MNDPHGLTARNFMEQFPFALKDGGMIEALGETIAYALERRYQETAEAAIYPRIDALDESVLDLLAEELRTPFYNVKFPAEMKRQLIKETAMYYKTAGTAGACRRILQAAYPGSRIEEWFDYGGQPYHFRIQARNDVRIRELQGFEEFLRLIEAAKRLAAKLESVIVKADSAQAMLRMGGRAAIISRFSPTEQPDKLSARQTVRAGGQGGVVIRASTSEQPDNLRATQTIRTGGQAAAIARHPPSEQPDNLRAAQTVRTGGKAAVIANPALTEQPDNVSATRIVRHGGRPAIVHSLRGRQI